MTAFRAPRWLRGRHAQTVWGSVFRMPILLPLSHERWELPDGDFIDVDRLEAPTPDAPVVVVCHGLEGSSKAGYVRGLLRDLRAHGIGAVAINFRGCSGEPNRLPRFYHSGDTGDLAFVVEKLRAERPGRALGLAGFSLGGNVVAKYLGERGDKVAPEIRAGAVVSVPFDLALCAKQPRRARPDGARLPRSASCASCAPRCRTRRARTRRCPSTRRVRRAPCASGTTR